MFSIQNVDIHSAAIVVCKRQKAACILNVLACFWSSSGIEEFRRSDFVDSSSLQISSCRRGEKMYL